MVSSFPIEVKTTEREANHFFFFLKPFQAPSKTKQKVPRFPKYRPPLRTCGLPRVTQHICPNGGSCTDTGVDLRVHLGGVRAGGLDTCAATRWHHGVTWDLRGPELPVHPPPPPRTPPPTTDLFTVSIVLPKLAILKRTTLWHFIHCQCCATTV